MTKRRRVHEATLRAYLRTGSSKEAARQLGITESTLRQRLSAFYKELDVKNAAQAAYRLDRPEDWQPQL
jgi:DNA-binding NarL/FixJ family response regulator